MVKKVEQFFKGSTMGVVSHARPRYVLLFKRLRRVPGRPGSNGHENGHSAVKTRNGQLPRDQGVPGGRPEAQYQKQIANLASYKPLNLTRTDVGGETKPAIPVFNVKRLD